MEKKRKKLSLIKVKIIYHSESYLMTKKALLIGINYNGTSSKLRGCINDVNNVKKELEIRGYLSENIIVITDNTPIKPTRKVILKKLLELILSDARELYFHFSGHGSYVRYVNGDEKDRRDECLVPIDYKTSGMVLDDELKGILCSLSEKQKLICVLDCCHSGTGIDLAYNLYDRGGNIYMVKHRKCQKTRGECVMFSGCEDRDTSADSYINGKYQGAMTHSFLNALNRGTSTYENLVINIRKNLKEGGYSQVCQFSSGKKINLKSNFES